MSVMFSCVGEWDDSTKEVNLSEALFGEVAVSEEKLLKSKLLNSKVKVNTSPSKDNDHLSRKQWKTKQKNKRKCSNKYRQNKDEVKSDNAKNLIVKENNEKDDVSENIKEKTINLNKSKAKMMKSAERSSVVDIKTVKPLSDNVPVVKKKRKSETKKISATNSPLKKQKQATLSDDEMPVFDDNSLTGQLTAKLHASRFRYINEQMYTRSSEDTIKLFEKDKGAFHIYHKGFLAQVSKWPVKPLDLIINWVKSRPSKLTIADLGCGEAFLSQNVKNTVHSFDLVAINKHVIAADISKVPLKNESVDVVVFCLSLMGTNLQEYLVEANRILKMQGILKIAEVASRFRGVKAFVGDLKKLGFTLVKQDIKHTHFFMFDFRKTKKVQEDSFSETLRGLQLKSCAYKKR